MNKLTIVPMITVFFAIAAAAGCTQFFGYPDNVGPEDGVTDGENDTTDAQTDAGGDEVSDVGTDDAGDAADVVEEEDPCGNGEVDDGEECDDGNDVEGDGCENDCTWTCEENADCRDEELCNGEETCNGETHVCEDGGDLDDGFVCDDDPRSICLDGACGESTCGDGYVDTGGGESCEPPGEGDCSAECRTMCEGPEDCPDDGNECNGEEFCDTDEGVCARRDPLEDGTECGENPEAREICISNTCQESLCGDSFTDSGADPAEECDDGNSDQGDGCDNDCAYSCHVETQEIECDDELGCTQDVCIEATHVCGHDTLSEDVVCRPAAGDCDAAESCTGVGPDCPEDGFLPGSFTCRPADGGCDVDETCPGDSAECPADAFMAGTVECRGSAGDCDVAESCTGDAAACPEDGFLPDTTVCRSAAGNCDVAESCTGGAAACPANGYRPDTTVCRSAAGDCDVAETCTGSGPACPANGFAGEGAECDDDDDCTTSDECNGSGGCAGDHLNELAGISKLEAGGSSACVLLTTDKMKCWGYNANGELGLGNWDLYYPAPMEVTGLGSTPAAMGVGGSHACAVLDTGAVKCWGANDNGQVGDGTTTKKNVPTAVSGLASGVQDVALGGYHSCALLDGGGVKCWGQGTYGQIGDGETLDRTAPVDVTGLGGAAAAIALGSYHSCAVVAGGLKCWGRNSNGQLGNNSTDDSPTPVDVSGLGAGSGVTAVACGAYHTCALLAAGAMKCWGFNSAGALGDGTTDERLTPVDVTGLSSSVTSISLGQDHTCAVHGGAAKCWGSNYRGQVGDRTVLSRSTPTTVYGLSSGVNSVAAESGANCALLATSKAKCWGGNSFGQLGNGTTTKVTTPVDLAINPVTMVHAGQLVSCATDAIDFKCWGTNEYWQIGNGTQLNTAAPTSVTGLGTDIIQASSGSFHVCAVEDPDADGKGGAKCWGWNSTYQLGDGTSETRPTPVDVSGLTANVRSISSGAQFTCALVDADNDTIGGAKCWGSGASGQIGDGGGTSRSIPVNVSGLTESTGVRAVVTGNAHACALTAAGGVKCWGYGMYGRLGNGGEDDQDLPVDVTGLGSGVAAISAGGGGFTCALLDTGEVRCWGENSAGQLGDNTSAWKATPVQVLGYGSGVAAIQAGFEHACAILDTGAMQCWGRGTYGQLGDGTLNGYRYPVDVTVITGTPTAMSPGKHQTCVLMEGGTGKCWGGDEYGETTGFFPGYPRFVACD
ncbi:MAG: hypothetical protein ABIJ56_02955 [Pseudomonadota bacterium]